MKVSDSINGLVERSGLASDGSFGILFNAKMAKILSDGLYSDKIQSIIRELSCNAIDSHVEAGKPDRPIEVHLPTRLEPWFHVRDFGIGLDHQQVTEIYTVYGVSTKTDSDDFIGQLGLGSKSPFSYVDAFDVTAVKDGVERHYSMYKNEQGMPSVAKLGEKATIEPNGVTVKMPVKQEDIQRFSDKAARVFCWFQTMPRITGVSSLQIDKRDVAFSGNGWRINRKLNDYYNSEANRPIALMGRVAYPLAASHISGLTKAQQAILETPLVLEFAIGELEVAASREALGYDERTQRNIRSKLATMIVELAASFEQQMADATTEWEARKRFGNIFGHESGFRWEFEKAFGNLGLKWKDKLIHDSHVTIKTDAIWDPKVEKPGLYTTGGRYKRVRQQAFHTSVTIRCSDRVVIIMDDMERGGQSRVNYFIETNTSKEVYFFELSKLKTKDEILALLGNPGYLLTSQMPKRPSVARTTKVSMLAYQGEGEGQKSWKPVDVILEDGGFYVNLDRWELIKPKECPNLCLESAIKLAVSAGMVSLDDVVHAPRGHFKKQVEASDAWVDFWEFLKGEISLRMTPQIIQSYVDSQHFASASSQISDQSIWTVRLALDAPNGPFGRFAQAMRDLKVANIKADQHRALIHLAQYFDRKFDGVMPSIDAIMLFKEAKKTYPMLGFVLKQDRYAYGSSNGGSLDNRFGRETVQQYINQIDHINGLAGDAGIEGEINMVIAA